MFFWLETISNQTSDNSPALGRFLSADTIVPGYANPQNLNRFSYVGKSPLNYTDPSGHMRIQEGDQKDKFKPSVNKKYVPKPKPPVIKDGYQTTGCSYTDYNACRYGVIGQNEGTDLYSPDYGSVAFGFSIPGLGSAVSVQAGAILDRFGNVYVFGGPSFGHEAPLGFSISAQAGFITTYDTFGPNKPKSTIPPGEQRLENMIRGPFANGIFCPIVCGGATGNLETMFTEIGVGMPQLAVGGRLSAFILDLNGNSGEPIW